MKFFNRYTLLYAVIVLVATTALYFLPFVPGLGNYQWMGTLLTMVYIGVIVSSVLLIQRRDEYSAYAGFNYHFITYMIVSAVPVALFGFGYLTRENIGFVKGMMLIWGVGLLIHFLMYLFIFRKKAIKSYDKNEIFK